MGRLKRRLALRGALFAQAGGSTDLGPGHAPRHGPSARSRDSLLEVAQLVGHLAQVEQRDVYSPGWQEGSFLEVVRARRSLPTEGYRQTTTGIPNS